MGFYCTTTTLETLWGGATFDALTATASKAIDQAENEINKILSKRYDVSNWQDTTTSIPPMVSTLCEWLSLGYTYELTARGSKDAYVRADRFIKKAHDNMNAIIDGKYNLVDENEDVIEDGSAKIQILGGQENYHTTFDEDDPLNWTVDKDKLTDISDGRS